jgi:hypothetical protein
MEDTQRLSIMALIVRSRNSESTSMRCAAMVELAHRAIKGSPVAKQALLNLTRSKTESVSNLATLICKNNNFMSYN